MQLAILILLILVLIFQIVDHWVQTANIQTVLNNQNQMLSTIEDKLEAIDTQLLYASRCRYPVQIADSPVYGSDRCGGL